MFTAALEASRAVASSSLRPATRYAAPSFRRSLHASSSVSRRTATKPVEDDFEADEDDSMDLFDTEDTHIASPGASTSQLSIEKQKVRENTLEKLKAIATPRHSHDGVPSAHGPRRDSSVSSRWYMRIKPSEKGNLKSEMLTEFIKSCETKEHLEDAKKVLRAWRWMGLSAKSSHARDVIGQAIHIGAPEIAAEILTDGTQFGLNQYTQASLIPLHFALSRSASIPSRIPSCLDPTVRPSIALAELHWRMRRADAPATQSEITTEQTEAVENAETEGSATEAAASASQVNSSRSPAQSALKHAELVSHRLSDLNVNMRDTEVRLVDKCINDLEAKGGEWTNAGELILLRSKWDEFKAVREEAKAQRTQKTGSAHKSGASEDLLSLETSRSNASAEAMA